MGFLFLKGILQDIYSENKTTKQVFVGKAYMYLWFLKSYNCFKHINVDVYNTSINHLCSTMLKKQSAIQIGNGEYV